MKFSLLIDSTIHGIFFAVISYMENAPSPSYKVMFKKFWDNYEGSVGAINVFLKEAIDSCGLDINKIDNILIAQGPGSFTGIKIGLAFCYGFLQALKAQNINVKILGFSSLNVILQEKLLQHNNPIIILKATAQEGYYSFKTQENNTLRLEVLKLNDIKQNTNLFQNSKIFIINKWEECEHVLKDLKINTFEKINYEECNDIILKQMIIKITNTNLLQQTDLIWAKPQPIYLRNPTLFGKN